MKRLAIALIVIAAAGGAHAQAIYRCGQTYSQKPCPDGKIIDSSDPRTAAQRAEAKRVAAREKQLAAKLELERKEKEAAQPVSQAASVGPDVKPPAVAASEPVKSRTKAKSKAPRKSKAASGADFKAVVPPAAKPASK